MAGPAPAQALGGSPAATSSAQPPKSQRGLNKPKCIQCGNVARSRCPYQSCKSCCSKAQNPCHIHVLKSNATFSEKPPTSGNSASDQQPSKSNEVSSSGSLLRNASLRQLSSNFAQFNNVHVSLRSKKPLTKKEALTINEWRFSKLKEYKERNIEAENEAFGRYMQNVSLLEDSFAFKSLSEGLLEEEPSTANPNPVSVEDHADMMNAALKLDLRSNAVRTENFKKRIQKIVHEGLNRLLKNESVNNVDDQSDNNELLQRPKRAKLWQSRTSDISDLIDKLNKARSEEDLKSCLDLKSKLFDKSYKQTAIGESEPSKEQTAMEDATPKKEFNYSQPKLLATSEIDQESLVIIDRHFSSLEQIEDL